MAAVIADIFWSSKSRSLEEFRVKAFPPLSLVSIPKPGSVVTLKEPALLSAWVVSVAALAGLEQI